ncbi:MAG: hypothetical protein IJT73_10915 [Selenomonadaceae bacterium]|nr:hypothetical protein [Selenomonadaceae bacterium]
MLTAEICVNVTAKKKLEIYTYAVPQKFNFLAQGWRVIVPFGRQIVDVVDDEIWFTPQMLKCTSI